MDYPYLRVLAEAVTRKGSIEVSDFVMHDCFKQPERKTILGDAIMNFCGLPTETEMFDSWARANEIEKMYLPLRYSWLLRKAAV